MERSPWHERAEGVVRMRRLQGKGRGVRRAVQTTDGGIVRPVCRSLVAHAATDVSLLQKLGRRQRQAVRVREGPVRGSWLRLRKVCRRQSVPQPRRRENGRVGWK